MEDVQYGTYIPSSVEADRLDRVSASARPSNREHRAETRRSVRAAAELHVFGRRAANLTVRGVTRNRSFHGISIVSDAAVDLVAGLPVEAVIKTPDGARAHLAGTIAFVRPVHTGREVGIKVEAAGQGPIIMHDPKRAGRLYGWFAAGA